VKPVEESPRVTEESPRVTEESPRVTALLEHETPGDHEFEPLQNGIKRITRAEELALLASMIPDNHDLKHAAEQASLQEAKHAQKLRELNAAKEVSAKAKASRIAAAKAAALAEAQAEVEADAAEEEAENKYKAYLEKEATKLGLASEPEYGAAEMTKENEDDFSERATTLGGSAGVQGDPPLGKASTVEGAREEFPVMREEDLD
jgi:membrane protein involved in colicin uptake